MRYIPEDLKTRIEKVFQTIYEDANPVMEALIVKPNLQVNVQTIRTAERLGSLDVAGKLVNGELVEVWEIAVVDNQAMVNVYGATKYGVNFMSPLKTFILSPVEPGAKVRDVAIAFEDASLPPWLFWVERQTSHDRIYAVQWDGSGEQPPAEEMASVAR